MRLVVSWDEEPISLFQDFARDHSPCRDDVGSLPTVVTLAQDLLHERGIELSHETPRFWWNRFGPIFAAKIHKKRMDRMRAGSGWRWHLDEVFVKIKGERQYLWRAVDHEGEVLEAFVSKKRDRKAALKFLRKLMKRSGRPDAIVTDWLRSYRAALRELGGSGLHQAGRWLNNRTENSHLPFRRREHAMLGFRRMRSLRKFATVHSSVYNHFNLRRHLCSRDHFTLNRVAARRPSCSTTSNPRARANSLGR